MGIAWREEWRLLTCSFTRGGAVDNFVLSFSGREWEWVSRKDGTFRIGHPTRIYRVTQSRSGDEWIFESADEEA